MRGESAATGAFVILEEALKMPRKVDTFRGCRYFPRPSPAFRCGRFPQKQIQVDRKWWIIDARDQVLGRVAVEAANLLRGKEK